MSRRNRWSPFLVALSLIAFASLACLQDFIDIANSYNNSGTDIPTLVISPTPECGGNVTGTWTGTADTTTYVMTLTQTGCTVTGQATTGGRTPVTVSGYVDQGIFHFSESGSLANNCYWTAALTIVSPGNSMIGNVTNCIQPRITVFR